MVEQHEQSVEYSVVERTFDLDVSEIGEDGDGGGDHGLRLDFAGAADEEQLGEEQSACSSVTSDLRLQEDVE